MKTYRYPNKRVIGRNSSGRFCKPTLGDFGFNEADGPRRCLACSHEWQPLIVEGVCPICGNNRSEEVPERIPEALQPLWAEYLELTSGYIHPLHRNRILAIEREFLAKNIDPHRALRQQRGNRESSRKRAAL